jgi:hypothetical protein
MSDSRVFGVLLGAAVVVAALFAPWYAVDLSDATRNAISQSTGQLPGALGEFARGILSVLPDRIVVNGWKAFERTDVVLLVCALAAAFAALLSRLDVAALAGGAAVAATVIAMVDRPGPDGAGALIAMQWGPWVALAGGALIVVASRMRARDAASGSPALPVDWSVAAPAPVLADPEKSVAPPS